MAPVEVETIPSAPVTPVNYLKVVDKAFELPVVTSAYAEIAKIASPYMSTITPLVEVGISTIKTKVEESVVPHIPLVIQSNVTVAVGQVTAAVEKIDTLACGGIDQLTGKVPALMEATPELIETTKVTATDYVSSVTYYMASFSLAQVGLKIADSGLDLVEQGLKFTGSSEDDLVCSSIKKLHTTANTIRLSGNKRADTEIAKKIEEASIIGAVVEVYLKYSGLGFILGMLGLKGTKDKTVYEDEHARVEVETEDDAEPVIVDTANIAEPVAVDTGKVSEPPAGIN
eukprot:GFUD01107654.1.p1 GENE.GFUD01107654.1~~GFUD01107654.1.p1  ORF type:complete len:286 (+),score=55.30 GFUD01107654.1:95-952(+)